MTNAPTVYRFLRILEYVGTREALDRAKEMRAVKGSSPPGWSGFDLRIFEAILGDADQPLVGQLKLWCLQQIVDASEGKIYPDDDSMRDGYVSALQDVLRFTLPRSEYKQLCGDAHD